jgi:phage-related tail fiber protein
MDTYPAIAHIASQLNEMWRMQVMMLSALDRVTATIDEGSVTAATKYKDIKTAADAQLVKSFVNGTFMDVQCASIVNTVGKSLELPDGHCALHIDRVSSECC